VTLGLGIVLGHDGVWKAIRATAMTARVAATEKPLIKLVLRPCGLISPGMKSDAGIQCI
jgi:hypothetical protein